MATINYNEYHHSSGVDLASIDPLYKWDTHYPERMSRLNMEELGPSSPGSKNARRNRRNRNRNSARFKTQPITFDEIKEVDEDRPDDEAKKELKNQFAAFSRSMDGIIPVPKKEARGKTTSDSNCVAAQASPAEDPTKANPADRPFHSSVPTSVPASSASSAASSSIAVAGLQLENLPQYDAARQARRQKRRHKKSITEEPEEGEKTNASQTGST